MSVAQSAPSQSYSRQLGTNFGVSGTKSVKWSVRAKRWTSVAIHHLRRHTGLGVVCAVAYFDPGNWSVDLQAGSEFGYKLLFVVLLSGLMAAVFQAMATRLGCVTGLDLATHCRMLLYNRPKHTLWYRWGLLYPLYAITEIAIISTDLAELLGSATALVMLFPSLPLWAGVLLTASDVFIILAFCNPTRGKPVRFFELLIAVLVLAVFVFLVVIIVKVTPDWGDAFEGFLPSKTLVKPGAIYTSIGIIGATVMPHGLFLGSSLATQDRVSSSSALLPGRSTSEDTLCLPSAATSALQSNRIFSILKLRSTFRLLRLSEDDTDYVKGEKSYDSWDNNPVSFVRAHLAHGITDVVMSLLGFAVAINALILIIASAVFFYGSTSGGNDVPADLFEAHDLIKQRVGSAAAVLFALALLCAGESAGITATLAGQIVSEGFIRWRLSPVLRRAITRLLGLIPSMLVAVIVGRQGLNTLLVASQVVLSFVLPFVVFPLVWVTSSSKLMRARCDVPEDVPQDDSKSEDVQQQSNDRETQELGPKFIDYSNGKVVMILGYIIWLVILVANVYVLVSLARGNEGCECQSKRSLPV